MTLEIWLAIAIIVLIILPPRYDPAIRLHYWLRGKKFDDK